MSNLETKMVRSQCGRCKVETFHAILHCEDLEYHGDYNALSKFMIIKCNGCHEISFRQEFHDYEMGGYCDDDNFDYPIEVDIFPNLIIGH